MKTRVVLAGAIVIEIVTAAVLFPLIDLVFPVIVLFIGTLAAELWSSNMHMQAGIKS
jgi:hypothetical protein